MIKEGKDCFYIGNIDNPDAEIHFIEEGNITIDHTYVSEKLRGQGIAALLLEKVVEYARQKNKKIIPICSYAKEKLVKEEYKDLVIG